MKVIFHDNHFGYGASFCLCFMPFGNRTYDARRRSSTSPPPIKIDERIPIVVEAYDESDPNTTILLQSKQASSTLCDQLQVP